MTAATTVSYADTVGPPPGNIAYACAHLGFRVFPVSRHARKHPAIKSWPQLATTDPSQLEEWWRGELADTVVGIACGRASNLWVLDIDVKAGDGWAGLQALLDVHGPLPDTMAVDTPSGGRHYYFTYPTDGGEVYNSQSTVAPYIDVRGEGGFVISPLNRTSAGEYKIVRSIKPVAAPAWLIELARQKPRNDHVTRSDGTGVVDTAQWIASASTIPGGRQEGYLFSGLCSMRYWDSSEQDMLDAGKAVVSAFVNSDPADPWKAEHVIRKVTEVRRRYQPEISAVPVTQNMNGWASSNGTAPISPPPVPTVIQQPPQPQVQPATAPQGNVWPNPQIPVAVARHFIGGYTLPGSETPYIQYWNDDWWVYRSSGRWEPTHFKSIRSDLRKKLEHAFFRGPAPDFELKPWNPVRAKIAEAMEAIEDFIRARERTSMPCWIGVDRHVDLIPCRNGLLDIYTKELTPHDHRFFTHMALPVDWTADSQCPRWLNFLAEVWPDDPYAPQLLQEWFGYVLSGKTNRHKIMLMVGDKRSGKGTIGRILTALLGGRDHIASPSMDSLKERFGLHSLLGKPLALIGDARIAGDTRATVEKLLTISGEDSVNVERKNQEDVVGPLPTRFMLLSNDPPSLRDSSGAMASRFLMLHLRESFLGKEDLTLTDKLLAELPGILRWALEGLDRLEQQSHFTTPISSNELREVVEEVGSPIKSFIEECCIAGDNYQVEVDSLFQAWQSWNTMQGGQAYTKAHFGKEMFSAFPKLQRKQVRDGDRRTYMYVGIGLKIHQTSMWVNGQL